MKTRTKLLYLMVMMSIAMVMLVVGVFAVKTTTFQVGGNITFNAKGINATISQGVLTDCSFADTSVVVGTNKLNKIEINTDKTASQIESEFSSWQGLDLKFNDDLTGSTATLKFSITNNATSGSSEYILASVTTSQGTSTNATVSVTSPSDYKSLYIDPQQTVQYTITFKIVDKTANASLSGFAISFDLERQTERSYTVELTYNCTTATLNRRTASWEILINGGSYSCSSSMTSCTITNVKTIQFLVTNVTNWNTFGSDCTIYEVSDSGEETKLYYYTSDELGQPGSIEDESDVITLKSNMKYRIDLEMRD